jgi:hypothetical protein
MVCRSTRRIACAQSLWSSNDKDEPHSRGRIGSVLLLGWASSVVSDAPVLNCKLRIVSPWHPFEVTLGSRRENVSQGSRVFPISRASAGSMPVDRHRRPASEADQFVTWPRHTASLDISTVEQASRVTQVYLALRRAIIEQALEPGAKLPDDAIGEQFDVSRTIARRALELLVADELWNFAPTAARRSSHPRSVRHMIYSPSELISNGSSRAASVESCRKEMCRGSTSTS